MFASIRAFLWKLLRPLRRTGAESSLDAELRFHLEMEIESNLHQGIGESEARRRALIALGGVLQTKESWFDAWQIRWVSEFWQDLRYAARWMRKNKGFAGIAVLAFAAGMGGATTIFSIIDGTLLRPLPYKNPERIVRIMQRDPKSGLRGSSIPKDAFMRFRQADTFEMIAASNVTQWPIFLTLRGADSAKTIRGEQVTSGYLQLLGVRLFLGRDFLPEDETSSAPVAILTHALWRRSFGADRGVIGKTVKFHEEFRTIIGVLPPDFRFPAETPSESPDILLPFPVKWLLPYCTVIGRLKPGVSLSQAQAEADVIRSHVSSQLMHSTQLFLVSPVSRIEYVNRTTLVSLFGAAAFLVLIACTNVANLQLARGVVRRREFAVRAAIGAGRGRLLRQLLAESLLLSSMGGLLGLLLAYGTLDLFLARLPLFFRPLAMDVRIDHRVLIFAALLSMAVGMISGLAPALQGSAPNLIAGLRPAERRTFRIGGHWRIRGALIAGEAGLALVLLVGSGLLMKSLVRLHQVNLGYDPSRIRIAIPTGMRNVSPEEYSRVCDETATRLRSAQGVQAAAVADRQLLSGSSTFSPDKSTVRVSSGYFETLGVSPIRGRLFTRQDELGPSTVAVINEMMAKRSFPGQSVIGRSLVIEKASAVQIIGIVPDLRERNLRIPAVPTIYLPYNLGQKGNLVMFRIHQGVGEVGPQVKAILNGSIPFKIFNAEDTLADSLSTPRFYALLMGLYAAVGLILTAVGISGITAQSVAQRRHEIGVRLALGAQKSQVVAMVVRQIIIPVTIGLGLGIAGAVALTRVFASLLYEVKPTDPVTFVAVSVIALIAAFLSSYFPGLRAARIDPIIMLRCE